MMWGGRGEKGKEKKRKTFLQFSPWPDIAKGGERKSQRDSFFVSIEGKERGGGRRGEICTQFSHVEEEEGGKKKRGGKWGGRSCKSVAREGGGKYLKVCCLLTRRGGEGDEKGAYASLPLLWRKRGRKGGRRFF